MWELIASVIVIPSFEDYPSFFQHISMEIYDWVLVFAVLFLGLEIMDDLVKGRATKSRFLETLSSIFTQVPFHLAEVVVFAGAVYGYFLLYEMIPWKLENTVTNFLVVLILADFTYYIEHYCMHRVRLFWVGHSVHHSSEVMNTATAFRFSLFDPVASAIFHLPLVLMGFNPIYIFAAEVLIQAYQFWLHNEMIGKLGPFEWIFNTPSHHRVHHGSNPEYIDKNYGGILIIWDRLFGTFAKETKLPTYGLTKPLNSINPVTVQFNELYKLINDLRTTKGLKSKLGYVLKAPGWKPNS